MAKPPADFVSLAESSNQNGAAEWCIGSAMVGHSPTRGNNRRAVSDGSMHAGTEQPPTGFNADRTATSRAGPDAVLSPSAGTASPADKGGEQRAGAPGPSSASPALSAAASDASESSADGDSAQSGANDVGPHNALQLGHGNSVRKVSMAPPSPPGGEESFVPPTSVVTPSKPCAATLADREAWQKQVEEQLLLKVQREFKERRLEDRREFQQLQMEYRRLLREERERNAAKHAATNARLETITEDQQLGAQRSEQLIREERKRNDAKHAANGKRFTNFKRDLVNSYEAIRDIQDDNEARDQANKQLAATVAENRRRQDERTNQLADTMAENRRRQDEATQQLAATVEANRREFESTAKEIREVMEKRHDKYEAESATLRSMCRGLLNEMKDVHTFRDRMGVRVEDLEGALSKLEGKRDELERIPATKKHTKDIVAFAQSTVLDEMEDVNSLKTVHFVKALADAHQGRFVAPSTIVKHLKGRGDKEPLTKEELKDIIVAILFGYTLNPLQLGRSYTDEDPSPKEIGAEVLTALGYKERGEANMNNIYKKLKKDKRVPKKREVTNGAVYFWYEGGPWKRMDKPSRRPTFSVPVA